VRSSKPYGDCAQRTDDIAATERLNDGMGWTSSGVRNLWRIAAKFGGEALMSGRHTAFRKSVADPYATKLPAQRPRRSCAVLPSQGHDRRWLWKLSRGLGIANLLIVHRLSDLDAVGDGNSEARASARGLLGDCSTKVIYQQEVSEGPRTAAALGLSSAEQAQLPDLQLGEGLWRIGQRAFVVRHVATENELRLFDTSARMVQVSPEFPGDSTAADERTLQARASARRRTPSGSRR
jgi:hypothetical protein